MVAIVAEPNKIAVQVEGFGKTVEGATNNNLYHVYFELEGDKIVRVREYNDTAHVFDTLRAGERRQAGTANSIAKDKEELAAIVKEMTESMTGTQSTRHWAEDALWFDIPPFASRGIEPALKFFDRVFGSFQSCKIDILATDVVANGDMGLVCTIQEVNVVFKTGDAKRLVVRETDCFERRNGEWKLIHQHASVPAGGDLDGKSHHGVAHVRNSKSPSSKSRHRLSRVIYPTFRVLFPNQLIPADDLATP